MSKILFTSLFGSKLYGTDTPESDTDYKAVFLPPVGRVLRGEAIKNSVTSTGASDSKNGADDEDFEMIPLQVLAKDFVKGQSYALEIVFNAIENPSDCTPEFYDFAVELTRFLTRNIKAMIGYAMNQANKYGIKGTRLKSIKDFDHIINVHCALAPDTAKIGDDIMFLEQSAQLAKDSKHVNEVLYNGPTSTDPKHPTDKGIEVLGKTFGHEITFGEARKRVVQMLSKYGSRAEQAMVDNGNDWKAISHALRIIDQAHDILVKKTLVFPLPFAEYYKEVKLGKHDWKYVSEQLAERLELVEQAQLTTDLPSETEIREEFYEWLDRELLVFYREQLTT